MKRKLFQMKKNYAELSVLILQILFLIYKFQKFIKVRLILGVIMTLCQQLLTQNHPSVVSIKQREFNSNFSFKNTNENEVHKIIKNLNIRKTGNDIPTKIIKLIIDLFSSFICQNINSCISIGKFPNELKYADVTPVHKKG